MEERKPAYPHQWQVMTEFNVGALMGVIKNNQFYNQLCVFCVDIRASALLWVSLSHNEMALVCWSMALRWLLYTPAGPHFPQMEHWGLPTWASLMQAAIPASLGIDLACRVQLGGFLSLVSAAAKEQNVCACHLESRICCSVWINTGGSHCTKRPWVNNWRVENHKQTLGFALKTSLTFRG